MALIDFFNIEMMLGQFEPDEDEPDRPIARKVLEDCSVGLPEVLARLNSAAPCTPEDYRILERLDVVTEGYVCKVLNREGFPNASVCPGCVVDDFTHTSSCRNSFLYE